MARIGAPRGSLCPSLGVCGGGGGVEEDFLEKGTSEARPKGRIGAIREGVTSEAPGSSLSATVTDTPLRWALFWLQGVQRKQLRPQSC